MFRGWKSGLHVATLTTTTKYSTLCYLYGRMLLVLLTAALSSPLHVTAWQQHRELSLFKLARYAKPALTTGSTVSFSPPRSSVPFSPACVPQLNPTSTRTPVSVLIHS